MYNEFGTSPFPLSSSSYLCQPSNFMSESWRIVAYGNFMLINDALQNSIVLGNILIDVSRWIGVKVVFHDIILKCVNNRIQPVKSCL